MELTAEQQLDAFNASANDQLPTQVIDTAPVTGDEDIIDAKVREGRPKLATTVVQNRSTINESQLEKHIAASLRKYPDILETELRQSVGNHLDQNDDQISEADYQGIVNGLVKKDEKANEQGSAGPLGFNNGPLITPPAIATNSFASLQDGATRLADRANALSTPGGIGFLIFVLMFFIWAIIPINNGRTRLQLLWGVITNQVYFPDELNGASGNFGSGSEPSQAQGSGSVSIEKAYIPSFDLMDEW